MDKTLDSTVEESDSNLSDCIKAVREGIEKIEKLGITNNTYSIVDDIKKILESSNPKSADSFKAYAVLWSAIKQAQSAHSSLYIRLLDGYSVSGTTINKIVGSEDIGESVEEKIQRIRDLPSMPPNQRCPDRTFTDARISLAKFGLKCVEEGTPQRHLILSSELSDAEREYRSLRRKMYRMRRVLNTE